MQLPCKKTTLFQYYLTTSIIYVILLKEVKLDIHKDMSGIYILQTEDGYRVSHSNRYEELVGMDAKIVYHVNGNVAREIFSRCFCYDTIDDALEHARVISKMYLETDDGICVVKYAKNLTFRELIKNGKNTGR